MAERNNMEASLSASNPLNGTVCASEVVKGAIQRYDKYHTDAYMIAVRNGFEGTEVEWLASLKGSKGDKGDKGDRGEPGASTGDVTEMLDEATEKANTALGNANTALFNAQSAQETASEANKNANAAMEKVNNHDHDERYYTESEVNEIMEALTTLINAKPSTLDSLGITASATELNYVKGVTSAIQTQLNDNIGKMKRLWVNSKPSSSFAAQTISLDLSGYDYVLVAATWDINNPHRTVPCHIATVGGSYDGGYMCGRNPGNGSFVGRSIDVSSSGVIFAGGYSGTTSDNKCCIPFAIFGIKI